MTHTIYYYGLSVFASWRAGGVRWHNMKKKESVKHDTLIFKCWTSNTKLSALSKAYGTKKNYIHNISVKGLEFKVPGCSVNYGGLQRFEKDSVAQVLPLQHINLLVSYIKLCCAPPTPTPKPQHYIKNKPTATQSRSHWAVIPLI